MSGTTKPTELISHLLSNATNLDVDKQLVAEDATYVSLNYNNPDLAAIEPWCGTHTKAGPEAIWKTFVDVNTYWKVLQFDTYAIFSDSGSTDNFDTGLHGPEGKVGTNFGVFGRFKYRARTTGLITDSPFCVWARIDESKGKVTYMQFMEDPLDTAKSFRKSGRMVYASNPEGGEVVVGDPE
ncbi:hypothetical protein LTR37_021343 [Vermiconidia calcicola]|uniref:Uncharacterized protein n=1 Tax=Vermiconidia calcicola TaxID=1690605 RepID=A0ACC3M9Z3_9PEZI|nr:hypothetical protein LTR37_021343 [Vermiconidia calcicola]